MLENNSIFQSFKWKWREPKLKRELRKAEVAYNKDVEALADLDDKQVRFLANVAEVPDPLSDDIADVKPTTIKPGEIVVPEDAANEIRRQIRSAHNQIRKARGRDTNLSQGDNDA